MIKRRILRWEVIPDYPSRLDVIPASLGEGGGKARVRDEGVTAEAEDVVTQSHRPSWINAGDARDFRFNPWVGKPLEDATAIHSSILV